MRGAVQKVKLAKFKKPVLSEMQNTTDLEAAGQDKNVKKKIKKGFGKISFKELFKNKKAAE